MNIEYSIVGWLAHYVGVTVFMQSDFDISSSSELSTTQVTVHLSNANYMALVFFFLSKQRVHILIWKKKLKKIFKFYKNQHSM